MKFKWQWFLGGRIMFWVSTALLVIFLFGYIVTFIIDPMRIIINVQERIDERPIKAVSEEYVASLNIKISKPIYYRFVKYKAKKDIVLLGTFHEWNNKYYIDISIDTSDDFYDTIIHETRHMLVQELKNRKIIDLTKYTEEIAQGKNDIYNNLFDKSIELLRDSEDKK